MNTNSLFEAFLSQAFLNQKPLHERWVNVSFSSLYVKAGLDVIIVDIQKAGRLDCVVTELENSTNWKEPNEVNLLGGDFMMLLAEEWVSRTYEVLRLIKQRLLANSELRSYWTEELNSVFEKFEKIRVSLFKREIHKGAKLDHKVELITADGEATPYIHGSSVTHSQPRIREVDNSLGYVVYNSNTKIEEILFRKDLSKHILKELLELRMAAD